MFLAADSISSISNMDTVTSDLTATDRFLLSRSGAVVGRTTTIASVMNSGTGYLSFVVKWIW